MLVNTDGGGEKRGGGRVRAERILFAAKNTNLSSELTHEMGSFPHKDCGTHRHPQNNSSAAV